MCGHKSYISVLLTFHIVKGESNLIHHADTATSFYIFATPSHANAHLAALYPPVPFLPPQIPPSTSIPPLASLPHSPTMPVTHHTRKTANERLAREKALQTHVYISGLSGHHTLQTGLAYYYRGHYIYAYPAGNLIEPIPYSTRKGIKIQGIVSVSAPRYDSGAEHLVEESSVHALAASIENEREREREKEKEKLESEQPATLASGEEEEQHLDAPGISTVHEPPSQTPCTVSPPPPPPPPPAPSSLDPKLPPRAFTPLHLHTFTPQPGLAFLAASAPGSRLASRAASPAAGLRPTSSHVGLAWLQGRLSAMQRGLNACSLRDGYVGPHTARGDGKIGHLPGLGDHALDAGEVGRGGGAEVKVGATDRGFVGWAGGAGRGMSCVLHGEGCEGGSTEWAACKTDEMRRGDVPMVRAGGREMVDWAGLLGEATGDGRGL